MKNKPLLVGVTGGIGSGKTTVCKVFETLGANTYYADDRAKWLMGNEENLVRQIQSLFGKESHSGGKLHREYIAAKVFKDSSLLKQLNELVHPAVARDFEEWTQENQDKNVLLKEAALLFETGSYKALDKNILVTAPEEVRVKRVISRDKHRTANDVKDIIANQLKDEEKKPMADFVIVNDGHQSVIKQVQKIYGELIIT